MNKRLQNRIAFSLFIIGGLILLKSFGLYFVITTPILILLYVLIILNYKRK